MYPLCATIWCGWWSGGIVGPYFFENEEGATISHHDKQFFVPVLHGINEGRMIICFVCASLDGPTRNYTILQKKKKLYFRKKLIYIVMGTLISKINLFRTQKTHTWCYRNYCTHYERLFGAPCRAEASLAHMSLTNDDSASITVNEDIYRIIWTIF